ncbi:MAG: ROK family transcriptional regulator [Ktedonobacteraceae bacterium]
MSMATILGITSHLISEQLVIESGVAASTGGRRAGLLEIFPSGRYAIGINLDASSISAVLLNLNGEVLRSSQWSATLRDHGDQAVALIAAGVEAFIADSGISHEKILGLGCSTSGYVDKQAGVSVDSWTLNWHGVRLAAPLGQRLRMPVFVDNDVNCLAGYERLFGQGKAFQDFLVVNRGHGVGAAFVIHDDVYRGAHNGGGEIGHVTMVPGGLLCQCGKRGCLEAYTADYGILATYRERLLAQLPGLTLDTAMPSSVQEIFAAASRGDELAHEVCSQTGTMLGMGLATLVNLMNPECIILYTGGDKGEALLGSMRAALRVHTFSRLDEGLPIFIEHDMNVPNWALGAGCLVLRSIFAEPKKSM